MVTRVSTIGNYSTVLANLMSAQQAQLDASERVSTHKNATDLKGFAANDELLTAMQSVSTRLDNFQTQNNLVADKLTTQDTALGQVASATQTARQAIADALASGDGTTLMSELQGAMDQAVGAMNTKYNGSYIFAGGAINTQPVTATTLASLTAGPPISTMFQNDQFKAQAQVDDSTTVTTGVLASDVGTPVLTALQGVEAFDQGGSGPFNGTLTAAQKTFLEAQLTAFDAAHTGVITITAQNGMAQQRVESVKTDLTSRQNTIGAMMSNITDADMGKAAADLTLAQTSFAAAAQVFQTLKNSSLLNLLQIQ
ncbi:flagellin [Phenylobacterium sp.]|uniref:flagellin N-terminal helical domain-containing protein n=1 Tax=Phenylobacterium sp. TaxID=1871053 RepID=UPI002DE786C1|nr:flagellin [Phenylobacterium sp.]